MRAFVEHRGHYGFLGFNPKFTLYLQVEFSDEERAIIGTRALQHYVFDLSPGYLGSSESRHSRDAIAAFELGGIALFIGGFASVLLAAAVPALGPVVLLSLFAGPALFWYAQLAKLRERSAYTKQVTVGWLAANPSISIKTVNPAQATILEENVRARLAKLKHFLTETHELTTPRMFEM